VPCTAPITPHTFQHKSNITRRAVRLFVDKAPQQQCIKHLPRKRKCENPPRILSCLATAPNYAYLLPVIEIRNRSEQNQAVQTQNEHRQRTQKETDTQAFASQDPEKDEIKNLPQLIYLFAMHMVMVGAFRLQKHQICLAKHHLRTVTHLRQTLHAGLRACQALAQATDSFPTSRGVLGM